MTTSARPRVPRPARATFFGFLVVLAIGTILLMLPVSTVKPGGLPIMPALFTATSALCVTGLTNVDTATYWTEFGHVVIISLIQIGGFGVMSAATVLGVTVTRRLSLSRRISTAAEAHGGLQDVKGLLRRVLVTGLAIEGTIAAILTIRFLTMGYPWWRALWHGLFHAVSAFNNAGFSLYSDGIIAVSQDPVVAFALTTATVLGGMGFPVLWQLRNHWRTPLKWTMNTRIVVVGTLLLLVLSTTYITALEWNNTLADLDPLHRVMSGYVTAVQTRTSGFGNIDYSQMHGVTWLGMDVLMFVGAGPAGTAGGIKVTTFGVLFFILLNEIRGHDAVVIFGKRLPPAVQREAITVALLAVALVVSATGLLMALTPFKLDQVLFEACSAFGTVGLTTGITPHLNVPAQLVICLLMFVGRLGPITFATALSVPNRPRLYDLPQERPIIG